MSVAFLLLSLWRAVSAAPCTVNIPAGLDFCGGVLNTEQTFPFDAAAWTPALVDAAARNIVIGLVDDDQCTTEQCDDADIGDAACVSAAKEFACRWALAPNRDWTSGDNCDDASLEYVTETQCTTMFSACGYTDVSINVAPNGGPGLVTAATFNQTGLCQVTNGPLDMTPPLVTGCDDIRILNTSSQMVDYKTASASDEPSDIVSELYDPADETVLLPVGETTITYSADDGAGNRDGCSFLVSIGVCTDDTDCNGGTCTDGLCDCPDELFGDTCENVKVLCPGDSLCSLKGDCDFFVGECQCIPPYSGELCGEVDCPTSGGQACNGKGICRDVGVCTCDMGWIGFSCQIEITDNGMTSGQFAGAVIGGLMFSFCFLAVLAAYVFKDDSVY